MSTVVYPILQSGFVSFDTTGLRKPEVPAPGLQDVMIFKVSRDPLAKYFFNQEITAIQREYQANPSLMRKFDFRERIIKICYKLFNNNSFARWIEIQQGMSTYSDMHSVFIIETLDYIFSGKPRTISIFQWPRLLEASERTSEVKTNLVHYFGDGGAHVAKFPRQLTPVVQMWLSWPEGFEDMMYFLYTVFGARSGMSAVTNSTKI